MGNIQQILMSMISIGTHWIVLYVNDNNVTYFNSFGIIKFIGNKNITTNIYRVQAYDSIMWWYFCIRFIDFLLKGQSLLEHKKLFSPNYYGKNGKIILKLFQ